MKPIIMAIEHSVLVYDNPKDKSKFDLLKDAIEFIPFEVNRDPGYFALYKDHAVFAFAGSDDWRDWLQNFNALPLDSDKFLKENLKDGPWGSGIIHNGFYDTWLQFKDKVDKIVRDHKLKKKAIDIYLFGHSLGGTSAELGARHLAKNHGIKNSCITFGCPAVGTSAYRDEFRSLPINGTRVVHGFDIVPEVPPFFKHGCANKVSIKKSFWKSILLWLRIADHLKENYYKIVKKRFSK